MGQTSVQPSTLREPSPATGTNIQHRDLIGRPDSAPDLLVEALAEDEIEAIVSPALLAELRRVLARPKFRRYADQKAVDEYVDRISRHVRHVDAIVSVDLDLLDSGIDEPVVRTPREIVDSLSSR